MTLQIEDQLCTSIIDLLYNCSIKPSTPIPCRTTAHVRCSMHDIAFKFINPSSIFQGGVTRCRGIIKLHSLLFSDGIKQPPQGRKKFMYHCNLLGVEQVFQVLESTTYRRDVLIRKTPILSLTECRFHPGLGLWIIQMVFGSAALGVASYKSLDFAEANRLLMSVASPQSASLETIYFCKCCTFVL